jgi:hypothetical protein
MRIVRDTECNKNHRTNAAERPPIGVKAGLQRASTQYSQQVLPQLWGETRRAPRHVVLFQTAKVALALPQLLRPSADPHLARNGRLGEVASLPQPTGLQAAVFTLRTGELSWSPSHGDRV